MLTFKKIEHLMVSKLHLVKTDVTVLKENFQTQRLTPPPTLRQRLQLLNISLTR